MDIKALPSQFLSRTLTGLRNFGGTSQIVGAGRTSVEETLSDQHVDMLKVPAVTNMYIWVKYQLTANEIKLSCLLLPRSNLVSEGVPIMLKLLEGHAGALMYQFMTAQRFLLAAETLITELYVFTLELRQHQSHTVGAYHGMWPMS